jgi:hypothetical protein
VPATWQSFIAVGLEHEAPAAHEMQSVVHLPPQLCSVDWQPIMQPVSPWHRLLQCWYCTLHPMAQELACVRHDCEVEHGP